MQSGNRILSIDILRGIVMVVMALDHVRNYFGPTAAAPEDLDEPGLALFLTRWVTHFCAPVFIFLSGASAWLYMKKNDCGIAGLRHFLVSRGIWLILVEFLLINPAWPLWMDGYVFAQVIWAIGWSMVVLGLLLPLGTRALLFIGLVMCFGHNLLDGLSADGPGAMALIWKVLHEGGAIALSENWTLLVFYPLVPWIGVMMIGYAFGGLLQQRGWMKTTFRIGLFATFAFLVLRGFNFYGNPGDWELAAFPQSLVNFLNTQKYPPSLHYLLMTLGPALMLLPLLERWNSRAADWARTFGRVPFFYYVLHFPLIHAIAIAYSQYRYGEAFWWFRGETAFPADYSFSLAPVYVAWIAVVLAMYPLCKWFAGYKRRNAGLAWLGYV